MSSTITCTTDTDTPEITSPAYPAPAGPVVTLVPYDPGTPPPGDPTEPDTQCDCACFAVEGQSLPVLEMPVSFFLELTPTCNNHCPGCGNVFATSVPGYAPAAAAPALVARQWQQILDKIQAHAFRIKLTGGEPTAHPGFETIVEHLVSINIPFTIFSNGRWQAPRRLLAQLRRIPNFQGFLISLHGPTTACHEAFTAAPGSFAETLACTRLAIDAGLAVSLSCVLTHHNWRMVDETLALARRIGAGSVIFNRYIGREIAGLTPDPEELRRAVHRVQVLRIAGEPVKFGNCLPQCFAPTGQAGCLAGIAFCTVDPWGQVRPCNHTSWFCGSLLHQSLAETWNAPNMVKWRQIVPPVCRGCKAFATCRGGCRAQAIASGCEADPLIHLARSVPERTSRSELTLYAQAQPIACFARRPESFGTLLLRGNRLFPVGHEFGPLLDALDGQITLYQILASYGTEGLALVASLYQQGMIELAA
jgi:radical SAM protein with 4Fe4S-binding SPASM domain